MLNQDFTLRWENLSYTVQKKNEKFFSLNRNVEDVIVLNKGKLLYILVR